MAFGMTKMSCRTCVERAIRCNRAFLLVFLLWGIVATGYAQELVSGKVVDENAKAIVGVSVRLKKTGEGTSTDNNGHFSLMASLQDTLVFSYLGYSSQEIVVTSYNELEVRMTDDGFAMEEVVVVGFGKQKLPTVTGSISVVEGKDLVQTPVANVSNMLVGMAPGITGMQNSGEPGQNSTTLRIRGTATLNGANPLVVIDGVQQPAENPFAMFDAIDANDIANISILKDASATAVFGIRGANGVIIVTTKRGAAGPPTFNVSANRGLTNPTALIPMTNSYEFAKSRNESIMKLQQAGNGSFNNMLFSDDELWKFQNNRDYTSAEIDAMTNLTEQQRQQLRESPALYFTSRDWYKELFSQQGIQNQYNVNVNGGREKFKYASSLGYFDQTGILAYTTLGNAGKEPKYSRYNFRNNFDIKVTRNLDVNFNLSAQFINNITANPKSDNFSDVESSNIASRYQAILYSLGFGPFISPGIVDDRIVLHFVGADRSATNPVGTIRGGNGGFPSQVFNPLNVATRGYGVSQGTNLSSQIRLNHTLDYLTNGLKTHFTVAYDDSYTKGYAVTPGIPTYAAYRNPSNPNEIVYVGGDVPVSNTLTDYLFNRNYRRTYYEAGVDYSTNINKHAISGLLLGNAQRYLDNGLQYSTPSGLMSAVGRATYNYDERYLVEGNMAYNGTEQFAPGRRFGFFPAFSAGWIISNESFFKQNDWFTFAKIRGSYGEVGNDQIGNLRYLYLPNSWAMGNPGNGYYFGSTDGSATNPLIGGAFESAVGNPLVTWERAKKTNIQMDLNFFRDRLTLSGTYFDEKRRDILVQPTIISANLGVAGVPASNVGEVSNKGWEFELGWNDHINNDLSYSIKSNFSYTRNKIDYMAEAPFPFPWMNQTGFMIGQPKGLIADGFYNTQEELANRAHNSFSPVVDLGDIRYKDINGDGLIDNKDQVPIGYPTFPLISFNTRVNVNYKQWDFSALIIGTAKGSYDLSNTYYGGDRIIAAVNEGRWTPEKYAANEQIDYPAFNAIDGASQSSRLSSTFWLRPTDFVRLKNVMLGYNFASHGFMERARIKGFRVFVSGNNLLTWTDLVDGIDPESTSQNSNGYVFPLVRTYNMGVNLTF